MVEGFPRIAVGGIHIESSTFSPHRASFRDFTVVRGEELLARYESLPAAQWVPLVHARALPGGAVTREFFDRLAAELVESLRLAHREAPLDGVHLDIHGAMSVDGLVDAEGGLAAAVRDVVGPAVLVSASMDPHGNVSRQLVDNVDLLTSHRMSPHEDAKLTLRRAQENLVRCLETGVRPSRAWVTVPVLLPGEKACTRDEPAKSVYGLLPEVETLPGVIDAAVWIGYAWADEPRCKAAVVVSGTDEEVIAQQARRLAGEWWRSRDRFDFSTTALDTDAAITTALADSARPFFVSDSGDNPTAGGSGDVADTLARLLARPELVSGAATAIWASVVDPDAVAVCSRIGVGGPVSMSVGGSLGWPAPPVQVSGVVSCLVDDPVGGLIAVVSCGGVSVVVTSRRKPFHHLADFAALGLDPASVDVTVVKIGYLVPDLFEAARGWVLALSPGGVDQDIVRLGHRAIERPMYPLDSEVPEPDLTPVVLSS